MSVTDTILSHPVWALFFNSSPWTLIQQQQEVAESFCLCERLENKAQPEARRKCVVGLCPSTEEGTEGPGQGLWPHSGGWGWTEAPDPTSSEGGTCPLRALPLLVHVKLTKWGGKERLFLFSCWWRMRPQILTTKWGEFGGLYLLYGLQVGRTMAQTSGGHYSGTVT